MSLLGDHARARAQRPTRIRIPPLVTNDQLTFQQSWGLTTEKILQRMKALLALNILVLSDSDGHCGRSLIAGLTIRRTNGRTSIAVK